MSQHAKIHRRHHLHRPIVTSMPPATASTPAKNLGTPAVGDKAQTYPMSTAKTGSRPLECRHPALHHLVAAT